MDQSTHRLFKSPTRAHTVRAFRTIIRGPLKSQRGVSLIEVLITLTILSLLAGIATVSYSGHRVNVTKSMMKKSALMFVSSVQSCIAKLGNRWVYIRPGVGGRKSTPCKADNTAELQSKLDFTCPAEATCSTYARDATANTPLSASFKYYCLSITKEVSGKMLQVIVRVPWEKPGDYQTLCNEIPTPPGTPVTMASNTCKKSIHIKLTERGFTKDKKDAQGNQLFKADGVTKQQELKLCPWK